MRKPFCFCFCICENKHADQLCGDRTADQRKQRRRSISAFDFATQIVQSLYLLNPKSQASSYLLWLYSPVFVRPGRKPRRPVFSQRGSNNKSANEATSDTAQHMFSTVDKNEIMFNYEQMIRIYKIKIYLNDRWICADAVEESNQ